MKSFDIKKFKNLFNKQEDLDKRAGIELDLQDPYLRLTLAIRGSVNFSILKEILKNKYEKSYYSSTIDLVERFQYGYFYEFLQEVPLDNSSIYTLITDDIGADLAISGLNDMLNYFIKVEEYEKCAIISKFLKKFE